MLRNYGADSIGFNGGSCAAKRSGGDCDLEQLGRLHAKRPKTEVAGRWQGHQEYRESSERGVESLQCLTPAATPAYAGAAAGPETISSPYSETEDYMLRGYYEEELVYNSSACIESVQYNLYDMTPEELEDASESCDNGQTGNATVYEDSYDIDM